MRNSIFFKILKISVLSLITGCLILNSRAKASTYKEKAEYLLEKTELYAKKYWAPCLGSIGASILFAPSNRIPAFSGYGCTLIVLGEELVQSDDLKTQVGEIVRLEKLINDNHIESNQKISNLVLVKSHLSEDEMDSITSSLTVTIAEKLKNSESNINNREQIKKFVVEAAAAVEQEILAKIQIQQSLKGNSSGRDDVKSEVINEFTARKSDFINEVASQVIKKLTAESVQSGRVIDEGGR